jgi:delta24-sterol reductase
MDERHTEVVRRISSSVEQLFAAEKPFRIYHGSTNSTRMQVFRKSEMIDISGLKNVLSVNAKSKTVIVEPNVPMDKLVKATLKHGLVPPVVMEFPGITVGGGIQGGGGESSSFKWGCFNQTCNWYEVILANGDLVKASPKENADLFYGMAGASGTLGVITAAEIKLVAARKYVELTYHPVMSFRGAKNTIEELAKQEIDFLDGIMFSKNLGVIISGSMTDKKRSKPVRFSRAHDQWYYLHVQNRLHTVGAGWSEAVPFRDYLFRYDRGAFWVGRFAFAMFGVSYNRFTRWLLNPILNTRKLYQALQESGQSQRHIVQDLILPANNVEDFMNFNHKEFGIYPLWLCPLLQDKQSSFQLNHLESSSIINVGLWGPALPDYESFIKANQLIEDEVLKLKGRKWSYAHSYYTRERFWSIYDKQKYDRIRNKYHATTLPDMYDKLTVTKEIPINKKKALLKTIIGSARLKITS